MQPTANKKILLVEDEEFIRDLYKSQLDAAGFQTDAFGTGKEGLQALASSHYDLVILDIMLPDTNGLEILKEIKANEATKNIVTVLLTNLDRDVIIKKGFELGAQGYMVEAAYSDPALIVDEVKNFLGIKSPATAAPQPQTS